jgi:argonaute-like protein implicated in RNA metabolism and viral defense
VVEPVEGETIPRNVLRRLFPLRDFQGKRVVIQRDGLFRGDEAAALEEWAHDLGAVFHCVEVIKSGTPRLYASAGGLILQPEKGTALRLSAREAVVVSSLPPFQQVTPNPLHLRTSANFPIEQAIHSVLALTLLHFGSLRSPRLPVTILYNDEIAYLALQGIKPKHLEGTIPYWL